jgi:hypothetical protein
MKTGGTYSVVANKLRKFEVKLAIKMIIITTKAETFWVSVTILASQIVTLILSKSHHFQ